MTLHMGIVTLLEVTNNLAQSIQIAGAYHSPKVLKSFDLKTALAHCASCRHGTLPERGATTT